MYGVQEAVILFNASGRPRPVQFWAALMKRCIKSSLEDLFIRLIKILAGCCYDIGRQVENHAEVMMVGAKRGVQYVVSRR